MKKRIVSFLLALIMVLGMLPVTGSVEIAEAATAYTINGRTIRYTDVGWPGNGECWEYANRIYNLIWSKQFSSDFVGDSTNGHNLLRNLPDSELSLTAENLKKYVSKAVPGSVLRMCCSHMVHSDDGIDNCVAGHNVVIVAITDSGFTYFESENSGTSEKTKTWSDFVYYNNFYNRCTHIKYIKWPGAPEYSSNSLIKDELPSYCDLKTTAATSIMSLPCSNGTDASSTLLESVSKGTPKTAYKLVLNRVGNYWYEVRTSSGAKGYIPSAKVSVTKMLKDVTLSNYTNPPDITQGDRYTIQGAIKSTYNRLAEVSVYIYSGNDTSNGKEVTGGWDYVSNNSYTLANSDIDMVTYFNNLAPGNYTYVVRASWRNYYAASEKVLASDSNTKFSTELQISTFSVAPKGHTHSWKVILNNTHHWEECASCGEIRNVVAHSWEMRSNATKHWKYCTVCAATIDNATHSFSAWAATKEPTYTSTGTDERSCSVCGHKETRTVDCLTLNKPQLSISTHYTGGAYLSWSFIDGAKKYEVYRATSSNGTYTKLTSTTSCTYTDSNLTNGTTYFYKVRAVADNNYSQYSTVKSHTYTARYTVSGSVTSFLDDEGAIAVELYTEGSTKAKYSVVVTGNTAEYSLMYVEPGTYTMKVRKKDHATREYRFVVSNNVTLFAEIFPKGDTDFDGDVNADDLTVLARHVAKIEQLTNAYGSVCADVDGNGSLSADDLTMLARYVAKIIPSLDDSPCIKHKWVCSGYDGNTGTITQYTCSVCKTVGIVVASPFLAPSDAEIEQIDNRTYVYFYSKNK